MTIPTSNIYRGTVKVHSGLRIRPVPSTNDNSPIGGISYGTKVIADRKQDGWWHLTHINGEPVIEESWSFEGHSNEYIHEDVDLSPKTGRVFAYVLKNFERPGIGVSRPTQNRTGPRIGGLPDTCKLLDSRYVPLTREWQLFWFALLVRSADGSMSLVELKKAWAGVVAGDRAFTNRHGPNDGYADYINGTNLDREPIKFEPIITGGNVVEILGGPVTKYRKNCWIIRTIDATAAVPNIDEVNRATDPYVINVATNSCRRNFDKRNRRWLTERVAEPFPQLKGHDVLVPILSLTPYNYIEVERVRILRPGEATPRPYFP